MGAPGCSFSLSRNLQRSFLGRRLRTCWQRTPPKRFADEIMGRNEFKIPEIIFDPTLVLSPHVCLLGMLFHINGFKSITTTGPVLDSPERLYSLGVLDGFG